LLRRGRTGAARCDGRGLLGQRRSWRHPRFVACMDTATGRAGYQLTAGRYGNRCRCMLGEVKVCGHGRQRIVVETLHQHPKRNSGRAVEVLEFRPTRRPWFPTDQRRTERRLGLEEHRVRIDADLVDEAASPSCLGGWRTPTLRARFYRFRWSGIHRLVSTTEVTAKRKPPGDARTVRGWCGR